MPGTGTGTASYLPVYTRLGTVALTTFASGACERHCNKTMETGGGAGMN